MSKATGSTASNERMKNMITQVNNNGDGNGNVLSPHIPPVDGEFSAEESKLMEGTTILPTLNVEVEGNLARIKGKKVGLASKKGKLKRSFTRQKIDQPRVADMGMMSGKEGVDEAMSQLRSSQGVNIHEGMHSSIKPQWSLGKLDKLGVENKPNIAYNTPDTKKNRRIVKKQLKVGKKLTNVALKKPAGSKKEERLIKRRKKLTSKIES